MLRGVICWYRGHDWKPDRPLSAAGMMAASGFPLWIPPATCKRCGVGNEPTNHDGGYPEKKGWYKEEVSNG